LYWEISEIENQLIKNYENFLFPKDGTDWISANDGKTLTGYLQPKELTYLLTEYVNLELN
jgi:hypothetical protein